MNWAVVYLDDKSTPPRHIPKLFITDVPDGLPASDIRRVLSRRGFTYMSYGTAWANYYLSPEDRWNEDVRRAWEVKAVQVMDWNTVSAGKRITFTLRLEPRDMILLKAIANETGLTLNNVLVQLIREKAASLGIN